MALNPLPQDKQRPRQRLLSDGVLQRRTQGTGQDSHTARTKPTSLVFYATEIQPILTDTKYQAIFIFPVQIPSWLPTASPSNEKQNRTPPTTYCSIYEYTTQPIITLTASFPTRIMYPLDTLGPNAALFYCIPLCLSQTCCCHCVKYILTLYLSSLP